MREIRICVHHGHENIFNYDILTTAVLDDARKRAFHTRVYGVWKHNDVSAIRVQDRRQEHPVKNDGDKPQRLAVEWNRSANCCSTDRPLWILNGPLQHNMHHVKSWKLFVRGALLKRGISLVAPGEIKYVFKFTIEYYAVFVSDSRARAELICTP